MNERLKDLLEKLGVPEYHLPLNSTTDEMLASLGCTVDDEGEILDEDGSPTGVWYEEVEY